MEGIGAKGLRTKLIVNYLPQSMTDLEFKSLFATIGPVESYKILRDTATNYSFGYGFIDFQKPESADRAIADLNGHKIANKTLRVAFSKPQGASKNINLFVQGLGHRTDEEILQNLFSPYGEIVNVKVVRDAGNNSRGFGFVLFKDKSQADAAIRALQGHCDGYGMDLQIKYAKESSEQQRTHQRYKEFVRSSYQPIQPVTVNYNGDYATVVPVGNAHQISYPTNSYGGGYSPVEYQKPPRGRGMVATRFNPIARPVSNPGHNAGMSMGMGGGLNEGAPNVVFAYNIGPNATEGDMYALFSKYGRINKVDVVAGKGYGFVHMPVFHEANEAVRALNGAFYNGKSLQVSIKRR
ncbi:ELAV-like protein 3 [Clytia hemisphaerica]|uniref:RRM domain-containing protein n=1 Tax=Clytia hemisphaerica TaxID=252671 RepID=A0A7M5WZT8_9CNID